MTPNLFYLDKETKVGKVDKGLVISQQFLSFYKHNTIDGEDLRPAFQSTIIAKKHNF